MIRNCRLLGVSFWPFADMHPRRVQRSLSGVGANAARRDHVRPLIARGPGLGMEWDEAAVKRYLVWGVCSSAG